jgi:hypothetical protein
LLSDAIAAFCFSSCDDDMSLARQPFAASAGGACWTNEGLRDTGTQEIQRVNVAMVWVALDTGAALHGELEQEAKTNLEVKPDDPDVFGAVSYIRVSLLLSRVTSFPGQSGLEPIAREACHSKNCGRRFSLAQVPARFHFVVHTDLQQCTRPGVPNVAGMLAFVSQRTDLEIIRHLISSLPSDSTFVEPV